MVNIPLEKHLGALHSPGVHAPSLIIPYKFVQRVFIREYLLMAAVILPSKKNPTITHGQIILKSAPQKSRA